MLTNCINTLSYPAGNSIIAAKASHASMNYIKAANTRLDLAKEREADLIDRMKSLEDKMDAVLADRNAKMILQDMNVLEDLGLPFGSNYQINDFFMKEKTDNVKRLTWYIMHLSGITDPPFDDVAYPRRILNLLLTPQYQAEHYWLGDVE